MESLFAQLTPKNLLIVLQLIILEGLLSFDNALALAALVKDRLKNPEEQKKALTYGIWGAYFFRILAIFIGVTLMKYEWVKAAAGGYLVYIALQELVLKHFRKADHSAKGLQTSLSGNETTGKKTSRWWFYAKLPIFWQTIIAVELMDIMFSIDSIGVALALSDVKWILITGAILGIIMMRLSAQVFIKLIDKYPILVPTAFVLVGLAGINVLLKIKDLPLGFMHLSIDSEIPEPVFLGLLVGILLVAVLFNQFFPEKVKNNHVS